jgi:hypothetical protein
VLKDFQVQQVLKVRLVIQELKVLKGLQQVLKELLDHRVQQGLKELRELRQEPKVILEHKGR